MDNLKKQKVVILFIFLIIFLFAQLFYISKYSEPYPAIRYPGFGKIPIVEGKMQYEEYRYLGSVKGEENKYTIIDANEIYRRLPEHLVFYCSDNIFNKLSAYKDGKENISNVEQIKSFESWFKTRLINVYNKQFEKVKLQKIIIYKAGAFSKTIISGEVVLNLNNAGKDE